MITSPIMFAMFLEDLELSLQDPNFKHNGIQYEDLLLVILMFADDMIIFGQTPEDLQFKLNTLKDYCDTWGLEVNCNKTKVVVFRKRGGLKNDEAWYYGDDNLDIVNDFNYLGTTFNYTGNFTLNQEFLSGKGLRALNTLMSNIRNLNLSTKVVCQLFDAFVGSILNYNCEVWGYTKSKELERIHLKFCKNLLHLRRSTSTFGIYGELGRYPLYVGRYSRIIKYWFKLVSTDNIILSTVYNSMLQDCCKGKKNWVSNVKYLLESNGFANVWTNPFSVNGKTFHICFKKRLEECFVQTWHGNVIESSVLFSYKFFKIEFGLETYLNCLPKHLRYFLAKLRLSSHSLRIETGRYSRPKIERSQRYCELCANLELEDEYHFVIVCTIHNDLRKLYIKKYYTTRPSFFKFCQLMQSQNRKELYNLVLYIKLAMNRRTMLTNNVI